MGYYKSCAFARTDLPPFDDEDERTIKIRNGEFRAEIYLDRIKDLPTSNLRKLFKLIATAEWENRETIEALNTFLPEAVADSKEVWHKASVAYQDGYRLPSNVAYNKRRKTITENKHLMAEVKRAKAYHEHWKKIADVWNETKTKFKIDN